jgi:hypothetical protein
MLFETLQRLAWRPGALKGAVAGVLLASSAVFALTLSPRRPARLAPILSIVSANDVGGVREAVAARRADLREVDLDGNTPLHIAVLMGSREMVSALLEAGADVTARSREGRTPLGATVDASANQAAIAQALVDAGASRDERFAGGRTLLHLAAATPGVSPKLITVLASGPEAALARDDRGETPLDLARGAGRPRIAQALQTLRQQAAAR